MEFIAKETRNDTQVVPLPRFKNNMRKWRNRGCIVLNKRLMPISPLAKSGIPISPDIVIGEIGEYSYLSHL
ncbi:MAG: hypothetical protein IJR45_00770 [Firmicutes bacterium]|nr:hypothetical protein [Bacillota bacterium]